MTMRIAREEIFGPVLGVFKWSDEAKMLDEVNVGRIRPHRSIWTNDISTAHRTAAAVEAGFVWINEVGKHFLGAPFGGFKQSGIGREECFEEMLAFTQEKNIHVQDTGRRNNSSPHPEEPERSEGVEGWPQTPRLPPSFETRPSGTPQDEG